MRSFIRWCFGLLLLALLAGGGVVGLALWHFSRDLPAHAQLADYAPPVSTRVHAGDGRLLAEYATQNRQFLPIEAVPQRLIDAFLAAEDKNFFDHPGIDPLSILRAVVANFDRARDNRRPSGASTITQQVAKNFLVGNELSMARKIREAILALRIEEALSKQRILELYLNEIYLGAGSYGIVAAGLNYFNKSPGELTVAEAAFLAALPKAPNNYHPVRQPAAAKARRDWVIQRMVEDGSIDGREAAAARDEPIVMRRREATELARADGFAEEVRRELQRRFGDKELYEGGLSVRTSIEPSLQAVADGALRDGLVAYDRRHGWRGPIARHNAGAGDWRATLAAVPRPPGAGAWQLAMVRELRPESATIGLEDGGEGMLPLGELRWARPWLDGQKLGPPVRQPSDALALGDVVLVEPVASDAEGKPYKAPTYGLRQIPDVNGALVALDPHTGRVLALSGGWSFEANQFNRATQARRQTGSAIKPFVYLGALDHGFTPQSRVLDAPFVMEQGPGLPKWKPSNYTNEFLGPSALRLGIEKSRNLMTVRLAQTIGMDVVADYVERFGVAERLPRTLAMSLGANETTLYKLTAAYAMLVNGGKRIEPSLIDRVQDRNGRTVWRHDRRPCEGCADIAWANQKVPDLPDDRAQLVDPATAYQMVSMLQGVVERGTATVVKLVAKPLAGKTGTSNDFHDNWFVGFSPDLAVGIFIGFDAPRSLGASETGGLNAAPIFRAFMQAALADVPPTPFRVPAGIRLVRTNTDTGLPAQFGDRNVITEAFKSGTERARPGALAGDDAPNPAPGLASPGEPRGATGSLGGLY